MQGVRKNTVLSFLGFGAFLFLAICLRPYTATSFQDSVEHTDHEVKHTEDYDNSIVIGINLGESHSQVGVFRNGSFEIITDEHGRSEVPSYVSFQDHGAPLVGFDAKEQATQNPQNTIFHVRRLMGRNFSDPEVQLAIKDLPYSVVDQGGHPLIIININGEKVGKMPHEISALTIAKLKEMAEKHLKTTIKFTVITVPAYFNDQRRQETKDAALLAGLEALRLVNEPTSIGIAYELDREAACDRGAEEECFYLLYNIKDKQSELALLSVDAGVFEIHGTVRDRGLGGSDFDIPLEANDQFALNEPSIPPAQKVLKHVQQLLDGVSGGKLDKKKVDGIIVTGQDEHITKVQDVLTQYFPDTKVLSPIGFQQNQAIVKGAAVQGLVLSGEEETTCCGYGFEILPLALGFELSTGEFMPLIVRNSVLPTRKKVLLSTVISGQEKMVLKIFEGQRKVASKNKFLGAVEIAGLPKIQGTPEIEISFEVDLGETLIVQARGHEGLVSEELILDIKSSRYQYEEFDEIIENAEKFYEEDLQQLFESPLKIEDSVTLQDNII